MSAAAWYAARAGGIVAFLLLSASVSLGLLMAGRRRFRWPRFAVEDVHRYLSIFTATFLVVHGGALLLDRIVPFSLTQVLVPYTSSYRPFAVSLGVPSRPSCSRSSASPTPSGGGCRTASGGASTT